MISRALNRGDRRIRIGRRSRTGKTSGREACAHLSLRGCPGCDFTASRYRSCLLVIATLKSDEQGIGLRLLVISHLIDAGEIFRRVNSDCWICSIRKRVGFRSRPTNLSILIIGCCFFSCLQMGGIFFGTGNASEEAQRKAQGQGFKGL